MLLAGTNSYAGGTTINAGAVILSPGASLSPGGAINFNGSNSVATLDIGPASQTISTITFPGLAVANMTSTNVAIINGTNGTLVVNGTTDLVFGAPGSGADFERVDVNLSGLTSFTFSNTGGVFRAGPGAGLGIGASVNVGVVTLANTNAITASAFNINDQATATSPSTGAGNEAVNLGAFNTLNVGNLNFGTGLRNGATLDFASGLTNPFVKIRNTDGISPVTAWTLGPPSTTSRSSGTKPLISPPGPLTPMCSP